MTSDGLQVGDPGADTDGLKWGRFWVYRVRWHQPHWKAGVPKTRLFVRGADARAFAAKQRRRGAIVEVCQSHRTVSFIEVDG